MLKHIYRGREGPVITGFEKGAMELLNNLERRTK